MGGGEIFVDLVCEWEDCFCMENVEIWVAVITIVFGGITSALVTYYLQSKSVEYNFKRQEYMKLIDIGNGLIEVLGARSLVSSDEDQKKVTDSIQCFLSQYRKLYLIAGDEIIRSAECISLDVNKYLGSLRKSESHSYKMMLQLNNSFKKMVICMREDLKIGTKDVPRESAWEEHWGNGVL